MAKHMVTDATPEEHKARSIIRKVIANSPSTGKHSKQEMWRRQMLYSTYDGLASFDVPTHRATKGDPYHWFLNSFISPQAIPIPKIFLGLIQ